MQITIDLPDEAFALADAVAKKESRSLGSVIAESLFKRLRGTSAVAPPPVAEDIQLVPLKPGHRFPVSPGRPITQEELDRLLEEDGLP